MADVEQSAPGPDGSSNASDAVNGTAGRFVSSAEGTALAYGSLLLMALLPIFFGALRSVGCSKGKVTSLRPYPRLMMSGDRQWRNYRIKSVHYRHET